LRRDSVVVTPTPLPSLDYYLIFPESGSHEPTAQPDGIVVEEFALAEDHSAVGLNSAGWTPVDGTWWSSAALSRQMRVDPALRARVAAVSRDDVAAVYRRLDGGVLPDETALRAHFHDFLPLANSAPLRLDPTPAPDGFADKRVYRLLFSKDLDHDRLASLRKLWRMTPGSESTDPRARVVGTARLRVLDDIFTWNLRRIGSNVAWCLDVTAYLRSGSSETIGPLLWELRAVIRQRGLIPVTVERFR
jgi:hypothetical protein